ncbi:helix-turn-helix domain-containing protein [Bacillus velezensis]|uniref:helix-turn-helix domain-containing protein n=1 Tax=Bacillus velezensis TaxID=492670 RepID=UPI0011ACB1F9|nr:helix-turn-helix domain-containing protein [Bacillus velezensis]TWO94636.1 XRE family transcriptional regulator [Bacillus velezensis]
MLNNKGIGDIIKQIRKEENLTQKEFSYKLGVSDSYISKIEKNKAYPSLKFLKNISDKFNRPIGIFFGH